MTAGDAYTLEQAELDIAALRGQADRLSEVLTFLDSTDPANNPAAGAVLQSVAGHVKYASSDNGDYNAGHVFLRTVLNQTISSTSQVTIGSNANNVALSVPVKAGIYHLRGKITWVQGATTANQAMRINGPAVADMLVTMSAYTLSVTGQSVFAYNATAINNDLGTPLGGAGFANGTTNVWDYDGYCNFSAAGTLSADCRCVTLGTDTYAVQAGSFLLVMPRT